MEASAYYKKQMQDQLCVKIDIEDHEEPTPEKAVKVRNRRYKKMMELRESGFFSEDAIKLRHPLLYHNYLGEHSQRGRVTLPAQTTLSQFLQKNLLNLEYRARLREQLECSSHQKREESPQWQMEEDEEIERMEKEEFDPCRSNKPPAAWELVQEEEIELEEQDLIDHAEQLFMQGKIDPNYINYKDIDNNSAYDELEQQNIDAEEEYFKDEENEEDAEINRKFYTGIQDF